MVPLVPSSVPTVPAVPAESEGTAEPADTATGGKHRGLPDPMDTEWPWETLRAEQEGREGTFTEVMRHEYRWDEEAFTRLEAAMRAGLRGAGGAGDHRALGGRGILVLDGGDPRAHRASAVRQPPRRRTCAGASPGCATSGSWFFNGTSPYGSGPRLGAGPAGDVLTEPPGRPGLDSASESGWPSTQGRGTRGSLSPA